MTFRASFEITGTWTSVSNKAERDILSFAHLPSGWYYGKGKRINRAVVLDALLVKSTLMTLGAAVVEAFPKSDGSIVVSGIRKDDVVDVTCHGSQKYDFYIERAKEEMVDVAEVSLHRISSQIRFLGWRAWISSDYSTPVTTHGRGVASIAQQFRNLKMVSPSLMKVAPDGAVDRYVVTSHYTTTPTGLADIPQSSFGLADQASQSMNSYKILLKQGTYAIS